MRENVIPWSTTCMSQIVALLCLLVTDIWCRLSLPYEIQGSKRKTELCPFGKEVNIIMKLNTVICVFLSHLSVCLSWTKSHFFCFTKVDMKKHPLWSRFLTDLCFPDIFSKHFCGAWRQLLIVLLMLALIRFWKKISVFIFQVFILKSKREDNYCSLGQSITFLPLFIYNHIWIFNSVLFKRYWRVHHTCA